MRIRLKTLECQPYLALYMLSNAYPKSTEESFLRYMLEQLLVCVWWFVPPRVMNHSWCPSAIDTYWSADTAESGIGPLRTQVHLSHLTVLQRESSLELTLIRMMG